MSEKQVKFISDEALAYLKANTSFVTQKMKENTTNSSWLRECYSGELYIPKIYTFEEFSLKLPKDSKDRETDFDNSILLYEHFKHLPQHIICDERFWLWVNFELCYEAALKLMPIDSGKSVFKDHWLFTQGKRRGLFFGVISRTYFRVALTVDDESADLYALTRFVIENPLRYRDLSFRAMSSQRHIVLGTLRAEKRVLETYSFEEDNKLYVEIAKYLSRASSIKILDCMTANEIEDLVFSGYTDLIAKTQGALIRKSCGVNASTKPQNPAAGLRSDLRLDSDRESDILLALKDNYQRRRHR